MLCTALVDAYSDDERGEIQAALQTLLSERQPDWSRSGVYVYWDRETHEILYMGLASDLPERFAQHNGLVSHGGGNKRVEIDRYLSESERLGFTILIQSKAVAIMERIAELDFTLGATASGLIAVGEGQLIENHRLVYGRWPKWNRAGGSNDGKRWARPAKDLLEMLGGRRTSLFVARRTLREVASDFRVRLFEATIHAARMRAVMDSHQLGQLGPETTPDERMHLIEEQLMLRDGHLVDDLDASDETIREWVTRLGDPEHWKSGAARERALGEQLSGSTGLSEELLEFLDSTIQAAAPPQHLAATQDILSSGYLNQEASPPSGLRSRSG
jgi:hypothetical protein